MGKSVDPSRVFKDQKVVRLSDAAQRGDMDTMRSLIAEHVDINAHGEKDITPLTFALIADTLDPLKLLLQAGAKPNIMQTDGITPLFYAVGKEGGEFVQLLLDYGADPNTKTPQGSILGEAVMERNIGAVHALLAKGAKPNINYDGDQLLSLSLMVNLPEIAVMLIQAGANPTIIDNDEENFLQKTCKYAGKYIGGGQDSRIYKGYVALWKELEHRGHRMPCNRPF